eukprot:762036-Hanusia_phi.AAC.7
MFTLTWTRTIEVIDIEDTKAEWVVINTQVAVVSAVAFIFAWNMFYSASYSCFCDPTGVDCWCSQGFDMRNQLTGSILYCFSAVAALSFMWSALYAVLYILIVNEMSDKIELGFIVAILATKVSKDVPGNFLVMGAAFLNVPIFTYGIFNDWFGLRNIISLHSVYGQFISGFCYFAVIFVGLMLMWGYYNRIPHFVGVLYKAKVAVYKQDLREMLDDSMAKKRAARMKELSSMQEQETLRKTSERAIEDMIITRENYSKAVFAA